MCSGWNKLQNKSHRIPQKMTSNTLTSSTPDISQRDRIF